MAPVSGGVGGAGGGGGTGGAGTGGTGGTGGDAAQPALDASEDMDATDPVLDAGEVDSGSDSGAAGGDDALFVPDIPNTYVGMVAEPGIEVIAHTIAETDDGPVWLAAVQNMGTDILCVATMPTSFLDENGVELASSTVGSIQAPLYRTNGGAGSYSYCVGPGDIGMVVDPYALDGVDISMIASIEYELGALNIIDAVSAKADIRFDIEVAPSSLGGNHFAGTVYNDGDETMESPWVYVFGLNAVGRPVIAADEILGSDIAAGSFATFETYGSFPQTAEEIVDFAAFVTSL